MRCLRWASPCVRVPGQGRRACKTQLKFPFFHGEAFRRLLPLKRRLAPIWRVAPIVLVGCLSFGDGTSADHALQFEMRRLRCENFAGWLVRENGAIETIMLDPAATTVDLEGTRLYLSYDKEDPEEYVFQRSFHPFPKNASIILRESDADVGYRALYLSSRKTIFATQSGSLLVEHLHNAVTIAFTEPSIGESGTFVRATFYRCSEQLSR